MKRREDSQCVKTQPRGKEKAGAQFQQREGGSGTNGQRQGQNGQTDRQIGQTDRQIGHTDSHSDSHARKGPNIATA